MLRPTIYIPSRQIQRLDPRLGTTGAAGAISAAPATTQESGPAGERTRSPDPELVAI